MLRLVRGVLHPRQTIRSFTHSILHPKPYATLSPHAPPPTSPYEVFDELSKIQQRNRALIRLKEQDVQPSIVDYVREEVAERLSERVEDLKIPPSSIVELAAHAGQLTRILQEVLGDELHPSSSSAKTVGETRKWWLVEPSDPISRIQTSPSNFLVDPQIESIREQVDAVVSAGGLHWVGDIVGTFTQIRHLLKPDGVFIGAVLGGDTLFELRTSLQLAEQERRGGIANRVSPMISPADAPSLLNRSGFTSTTVDVEDFTINYPSMWELMSDLRDMGESNAILGRRTQISRDVLIAADAIYKELYGTDDSVPATFQIIFLIGWKPGPSEPKALERGTGKTNLKDVL